MCKGSKIEEAGLLGGPPLLSKNLKPILKNRSSQGTLRKNVSQIDGDAATLATALHTKRGWE